jgi:hypothetical protein
MSMTTSSQGSGEPATTTDAAVTAILADWSAPAEDAATTPVAGATIGTISTTTLLTGPTGPTGPTRPTVRWGALVWALLFGAAAATTLWVLVDPLRRDAVGDWVLTLNPLTATLATVIVVGVVVALFGIVGLIRRGERARRR